MGQPARTTDKTLFVVAHHNIFEDWEQSIAHKSTGGQNSNDGGLRSTGSNSAAGNYFYDNILRNSDLNYIVRTQGNRVDAVDPNDGSGNVWYNILGNAFVDSRTAPATTRVENNIGCSIPTAINVTVDTEPANSLINLQSVCDSEVSRIVAETTQLPGYPGGSIPPLGTNILPQATIINDSANFNTSYPPTNLTDGCIDASSTPPCSTSSASGTYWIEYDLGSVYTLDTARLFGDTSGSWDCGTWTLEYRINAADVYSMAVSNQSCNLNQWLEQELNGISARYLKLTVTGLSTGSEAYEMEVYGQPITSSTFNIGDTVAVNISFASLNIRDAAGGAVIGTQLDGAIGTIIGGPVTANLPYSPYTPSTWWNIDYQTNVDGWTLEDYLILGASPTTHGDLNADGVVNSLDWSVMNSQWGTSGPEADLNGDGLVNSLDFSILNSNWSG